MALASGWRREDAVVSHATQRLEAWIAGAMWSTRDVDDGAPLLARSMARLLDARAVLLLVRALDGAWQPAALAQASPARLAGQAAGAEAASGEITVLAFALEENSPLALHAPSEAFSNVAGPLLRDSWSASQAAFAAEAALLARDEAALATPAAVEKAEATLAAETASGAAPPSTSASSLTSSLTSDRPGVMVLSARDLGGRIPGASGGEDVRDSNSVSDWAQAATPSAWQSEMPSLLLPLPPSPESEERSADSVGVGACGLVVAWIEGEDGSLSDEWQPLWSSCAVQAGAWLESALRFERVGRSYRDLAQLAARVVDARDASRAGHGALVAHACVLMARALGLGEREVEEWEMAGLLHGIGRVPIPDALLQKEGALSPEERDTIRSSMQAGAHWLSEVEGWATVARIVKHAGERWDGRGYPDGLQGEAIPLGSRALAIAMRFASLSQARPDRGALGSLRNVGAALESEAGRALDARLTTLFLAALRGGAR